MSNYLDISFNLVVKNRHRTSLICPDILFAHVVHEPLIILGHKDCMFAHIILSSRYSCSVGHTLTSGWFLC